ncbi:MAG: metal-dependent hydrolase [SAR324 cluster bacterium]|nr:metal-dependent hydrolase [SAR324 cluster bacterium]
MNFKGHITGGIITGAAITSTAIFLSKPLGIPAPPLVLGQIFGVALFFSMFPDLDISSIPQRWFFRAIFAVLLGLSYYDYFEVATLVALVSITPLLDHHRSWTHNVISVLLFPVVLACIYEYLLSKERFFDQWSADQVANHLSNHIWLVIACVSGWYTHLTLDFYQKKRFARN